MIQITDKPINPNEVISSVKTDDSGCAVTYVGLIRNTSHGKHVLSVEYRDADGKAEERLRELASEIKQKYVINGVAMCHRVGKLEVGDINLVFVIAAGHRQEGFAACQYAIDRFKERMPTLKTETCKED